MMFCRYQSAREKKSVLLQGIDRPTFKKESSLNYQTFFLTFDLDRKPKNLLVQGYQSQAARVGEIPNQS